MRGTIGQHLYRIQPILSQMSRWRARGPLRQQIDDLGGGVDDGVGLEIDTARIGFAQAQRAAVAGKEAGFATDLCRGPDVVEHVVAEVERPVPVDLSIEGSKQLNRWLGAPLLVGKGAQGFIKPDRLQGLAPQRFEGERRVKLGVGDHAEAKAARAQRPKCLQGVGHRPDGVDAAFVLDGQPFDARRVVVRPELAERLKSLDHLLPNL